MSLEEFALPLGEEADTLLAGLARLIELRGAETFVAAPILRAEPQFFPDPVEQRAQALSVLLRRLLAYAGLEPRRIDVEIYGPEVSPLSDEHLPKEGETAAAWFMGVSDGVYRFGVSDRALNEERSLLGTLGHEVAHAYRSHHRLVVQNREVEEKLTDLTTVYLGFGAFTLENSFQFRTGHYNSNGQRLAYERRVVGYLMPGQLAFLLAAQLVARNTGRAELKRVLAMLSANQAEALSAACQQFAREPLALTQALRLPPAAEWPEPRRLEDVLTELPPAQVRAHDAPAQARAQAKHDRVAFRVAGNRRHVALGLGALGGFLLALALDLQSAFWPLTIALALTCRAIGRRLPAPTCSNCTRGVRASSLACSACRAHIAGDIAELNDRFDAEEQYRAAQRAAAASPMNGIRGPACNWQPKARDHTVSCLHSLRSSSSSSRAASASTARRSLVNTARLLADAPAQAARSHERNRRSNRRCSYGRRGETLAVAVARSWAERRSDAPTKVRRAA